MCVLRGGPRSGITWGGRGIVRDATREERRGMNRSTKLILDIALGAVIPILILTYLTGPLGSVPAYLLSALIPVGWVAIDLLFVTRRFNFITSYLGAGAILRGLLAFWFVSGAQNALKDTAGGLLTVAVFAGSLLLGRPALRAFVAQGLAPATPAQEASLYRLFSERTVARRLVIGTALVAGVNVVTSAINYWLNLAIVVAPFGTEAFNAQVAQVNAITRLAIGIPEFIVVGGSIALAIQALYAHVPEAASGGDFWQAVAQREGDTALTDPDAPVQPVRE